MIGNKKMLIMFKKDCDIDCGNRRFIKFLNKEETCAIFYNPLIAPKYFKEYLEENKIIEVCEIVDDKVLSDNEDKIYTFRENMGVYNVNKGIELERKLVLFIEEGMELNLSLPRYGYKIIDNKIHLTRYKDNKKFCYVVNEEYVNPELRKIMIPVLEAVPGILNMDTYPFTSKIKTKIYHP